MFVSIPHQSIPHLQCIRKPKECAGRYGIPLKVIHITDKESAQNVPAPVTTYALFRDGRFLTQGIQSDKKFLTLAGQGG